MENENGNYEPSGVKVVTVGFLVGAGIGCILGLIVGSMLGTLLGLRVGETEGVTDGTLVECVGNEVGFSVLIVFDALGLREGVFVGLRCANSTYRFTDLIVKQPCILVGWIRAKPVIQHPL